MNLTTMQRLTPMHVLTMTALLLFRHSMARPQNQPSSLPAKQTEAKSTSNPYALRGALDQTPQDWFVPTAGYSARLVALGTRPGQHSVLLRSEAKSANPAPIGNLMRTLDAVPYRGKRVRFRASVRVEGETPDDHAQMWMRVDRANQQMGFFDNMGNRPISIGAWKSYEIVGEVAEDAQTINIGLMFIKNGKVWMDDVAVDTLGTVVSSPTEAPRPLTERGRANLAAFARLFGYARHFYAGDEAAHADWNRVALSGVRMVENAQNASELANKMQTLFSPLAPALQVFPTGQMPTAPRLPASLKVVRWLHHGYGTGDKQSIYHSDREYADVKNGVPPPGWNDPNTPFQAELGGGVACRLPLAVYADSKGTLPRASGKSGSADEEAAALSGEDRAGRLAIVTLAWNIPQHFYPYFDVVKTDWMQTLRDSLSRAAEDKDESHFLDTLRRMIAALHDGHGYVVHNSDRRFAQVPLRLTWLSGDLIVAQTYGKEAGDLKPGDVIRKINDEPVSKAYDDVAAKTSGATEQWIRYRALDELLRGLPDTTVRLEVQRGADAPSTVTLTRRVGLQREENRPAPIAELKPGLWYVDLDASRAKMSDFEGALPKLAQAKGLIFDMRGYPNEVAMSLLPHLATVPITSANWNIPRITNPDHQKMAFEVSRWPLMPPTAPHLAARTAFLTDGRAISYAESILGIVENYKLGAIVGEPTAGTNGNINPVKLPGGYTMIWTGMKVTKHDGSPHHGVGIHPTVPVTRTLEGITQSRDEILEKAIETISP